MANRSEAYDLSLFESSVGYGQVRENPQRKERPRENDRRNIVELPARQLQKNARAQRHPLKLMAATACFAVILATVISVVYSQVQLTELTEEINTTTSQLSEAKSQEIQLNMQVSKKMNGSQVENYAVNELGMSKIAGTQVSYVNVAQKDQGTVVQDTDGGSLWEQIAVTVRAWFD